MTVLMEYSTQHSRHNQHLHDQGKRSSSVDREAVASKWHEWSLHCSRAHDTNIYIYISVSLPSHILK